MYRTSTKQRQEYRLTAAKKNDKETQLNEQYYFKKEENVMSQEFIHNIVLILSAVSKRYYTPDFDTEFSLQFSLHMYQALQRSAFHIS